MGNMVNVDVTTAKNERQQTINNFGSFILYNPSAGLWHLPKIKVLETCMGNVVSVNIAILKNECQPSVNRASTILVVASDIIQGLR